MTKDTVPRRDERASGSNSRGATLVLDIGKSNAKLVLIDVAGNVIARREVSNAPVQAELDVQRYLALGLDGLEQWLRRDIPALARKAVIDRISISTHGAAFCALGAEGLVLPPIDYEWDGYGEFRDQILSEWDPFEHNGTPALPQGLNAGLQLAWVQQRWPAWAARIRCWVPYPQYWAWWFTGVACSEVSSLGCHTGLWAPGARDFSHWARRRGLAERFAPLRRADEVIGKVRPALAAALGLGTEVKVLAGAHDSNACLARYLPSHPTATVVSSGTWCVVMAPSAAAADLRPALDQLVNVAVDGRPVPTARFMGGREFAAMCAGGDPALATEEALAQVLREAWMAHPRLAAGGRPFADVGGDISRQGQRCADGVQAVPEALRPALAALYCAELCACLVRHLAGPCGSTAAVIVEGPFADNAAWCCAMASLLAPRRMLRSVDPLEGTARGAWMLARGADASAAHDMWLQAVPVAESMLAQALRQHEEAWTPRPFA